MQITFLGATGTVTGSKYLIKTGNKRLLVECGLFQGKREVREKNWQPLPFAPHTLDAVILTHAHIDHSGYLPLLVKNGYTGPIYCTKATKDLCKLLLPDSAYLQEEEAAMANKYGTSRHHPALALYTQADAQQALQQLKVLSYGKDHSLFEDFTVQFQRSGHILGSAFVILREYNTSLTFSGDLGRPTNPLMNPPVHLQDTDYLVLEATYGDRLHDEEDPQQQMAKIINATVKRGGSILIPAFAVGRAQIILYHLYHLKQRNEIPDIPVYLDSPMAVSATNLLLSNMSEHKLSAKLCEAVCKTATYIDTVEESMSINAEQEPKIIISASGMVSGGRVLHHLRKLITDKKNTILFSGYQGAETRGEHIISGANTVNIFGIEYPVKAQIEQMANLSAHSDYAETITWLKHLNRPPRTIFITHGEPAACIHLKKIIDEELKWPCEIPTYAQHEDL